MLRRIQAEGELLPNYRIYFLNGQGRIVRALDIDCADDDEARLKARELAVAEPVELWERTRLLGRFEPAV